MKRPGPFTFTPLTVDRWVDLESLFGERGACGGCWCMWWRSSRAEFDENRGAGNRRALRALVRRGPPPGILAYGGATPIGWCAVAPREEYPRLARARVLKPLDDRPVWSVTCLFVARAWRHRGVSARLLEAAAAFAASRGATLIEGYPVDARKKTPDAFVYTGLPSAFLRAGFREVARPSRSRPVMRRALTGK